MTVRLATLDDFDEILRLSQLLFEYERQYGETYNLEWTYSKRGKAYFKKRLTHKRGLALVCEVNQRVVGYLAGWIDTYSYRSINPIIEIENMFVEKKHRRKGVGSRLVHELQVQAKKKGVKRLKVEALYPNESASSFYRSLGFEGFNLVFEADL